jgi:hypothetical protein
MQRNCNEIAPTPLLSTHTLTTITMSQTNNENKTNVTSLPFYSKEAARSIETELGDILIRVRTLWVDLNQQDRLCLDIAEENLEEVYDRIRDYRQASNEVEAIMKRVAS